MASYFVLLEGKALLMVKREVERARVEWPLEVVGGKVQPPIGPMALKLSLLV